MSKIFYIEECSGNFNGFDYFLNAKLENGVTIISAFLNHDHIHFGHMLKDFKCMLYSLKEHYRNIKHNVAESKAESDSKEFKVRINPDENEITVILYKVDFDTESLIESFAYATGYVQSFILHRFCKSDSD